MLDNAPWHTGKLIRKYLRLMKAPVILMSPYSPMLASVEFLFGQLKTGDHAQALVGVNKK